VEEAATDVIALEQALGIAEPWSYPAFIDKIVAPQKHRQIQFSNIAADLQFFDRSPIDTYALSIYLGYSPSAKLQQEIERIQEYGIYQRPVFFMQNLGFVQPTEARRISFEQSLQFEKLHEEAFRHWGYEIVKIPPLAIPERSQSVLRLLE